MKKRRTKVLLTLLAMLAVGFATTNAYIFRVDNRDPFGTLNLSNLIIKASPTSNTGMELSGYKIRIKTEYGQLNVHKICDEDGGNCIEIANIHNGVGGITANGITGQYCLLNDDGNLNCNNSSLATIIEGLIPEITDTNTREPNTKDTGGYVAAPGNNNTGKVRKVGNDGNPGWRPDATGDSTPYQLPIAANGTRGGIQIGYNENGKNYAVQLDGEKAYVYVPWESGEGVDATGSDGKRCKYQCGGITQLSFKRNCNDITECIKEQAAYTNDYKCDTNTTNQTCIDYANSIHEGHPDWIIEWNPQYGGNGDCQIVCFENEPTGTEGGTRQLNTSTQAGYVATGGSEYAGKVRKVGDNGEPGWGTDATSDGGYDYTAGNGIDISSTNVISAKPNAVGQNGIVAATTMSTINQCRKTNGNGVPSWQPCGGSVGSLWNDNDVWLYPQNEGERSVAIGPRDGTQAAGSDSGNVRLFVNGNTVIADNGESVAKLGQNGVAFMGALEFYLGKYNVSTTQAQGRTEILASTIKGVSIGGPLAIGYDENNTGNYIYIYSEGTPDNSGRHFEIMGSNELAIGTLSGGFIYFNQPGGTYYEKYSIGVNTNTPKATLDVHGGVRVGKECITCTTNTVGTIIYYNDDFYGCKKNGSTQNWVSLTDPNAANVSRTDTCDTQPRFWHNEYSQGTAVHPLNQNLSY